MGKARSKISIGSSLYCRFIRVEALVARMKLLTDMAWTICWCETLGIQEEPLSMISMKYSELIYGNLE